MSKEWKSSVCLCALTQKLFSFFFSHRGALLLSLPCSHLSQDYHKTNSDIDAHNKKVEKRQKRAEKMKNASKHTENAVKAFNNVSTAVNDVKTMSLFHKKDDDSSNNTNSTSSTEQSGKSRAEIEAILNRYSNSMFH